MAKLDNDGDIEYVQGSGSKPYTLKNVGGVLSCDCMSWRQQSKAINLRSCKHLRSIRGEETELARIGSPIPSAVSKPVTAPIAPGAIGSVAATKHAAGTKLRQDEKAKLFGPKLLLANDFRDFPDLDPTGWWWSSKLDGLRAYWTGKEFISRQGNRFYAPEFFTKDLPDHPLDGELYIGRGTGLFEETMSIVRSQDAGDRWKKICFVVFDAPEIEGPFEYRMSVFAQKCEKINSPYLKAHPHFKVQSRKHLEEELARVEALGGEGLMLRQPGSLYERCRSNTLLKYKPFKDAEAVVIAHASGKGKHKGQLGALVVRTPEGKEFNLGTGLTDKERRNPPPIGCTITYSYTGFTNSALPKCCSFVRIREDV